MIKNNHGFTLIELMITLAVLGIVFAVALPDIMFPTTANRLSSKYNDMRGDFAFARNTAITRNVPVTITSKNGTDWSTGWTIATPTATVRDTDATASVMAVTSTVTNIVYNADGTATATSSIKLCDDRVGPAVGKQLNVNFAGRAHLTSAACP